MENKQDVKTNIFLLQKVSKKSKAKIVSCNKYQKCFVKTKSFKKVCTLSILIVSIYLFFFYVVFRAELIINLAGAFYSDHILIRHRRADSSLFHLPFRNKFLSYSFMVCNSWKRLCISLFSF